MSLKVREARDLVSLEFENYMFRPIRGSGNKDGVTVEVRELETRIYGVEDFEVGGLGVQSMNLRPFLQWSGLYDATHENSRRNNFVREINRLAFEAGTFAGLN